MQTPVQLVPETRRPGVKRPGHETIIHLLLVPGLTMRGALPPFPKLLHGILFN